MKTYIKPTSETVNAEIESVLNIVSIPVDDTPVDPGTSLAPSVGDVIDDDVLVLEDLMLELGL